MNTRLNMKKSKKLVKEITVWQQGKVYLIKHRQTKELYVSKKIDLSRLKSEDQVLALQEANLMQTISHPHIVQHYSNFIDGEILIIIMEYCQEGDLSHHIQICKERHTFFPENLILNWLVQILFGLQYLHELKILHRDLKSSNIFLTSEGVVKIGDLGISKILLEHSLLAQTVVGTPFYLAPELCQNQNYSFKSDIWSLGCVLFELCALKNVFESQNLLSLVQMITKEKHQRVPKCYSNELQHLLDQMLSKQEKNRPNVNEILESDFITNQISWFQNQHCKQKIINNKSQEFDSKQDRQETQEFKPSQNNNRNKKDKSIDQNEYKCSNAKNQLDSFASLNLKETMPINNKNRQNNLKQDQDNLKWKAIKQKVQNYKQQLQKEMGFNLFEKMYQFFIQHQNSKISKESLQIKCKERFGIQNEIYFTSIQQLIFMENFN